MEFHYSDLCVPTDHILADPYNAEYMVPQYLVPTQEGEYEIRSSVLVDGRDNIGVSTVVFDKFEELVWMGNLGGHVTSYYGPGMQRYTSFQIHATDAVRDIITVDQGIYCLTKSTLRHQIRRGLPRHTFRSDNMVDMQCLFQVNQNKLLMGGHQNKLLELDLDKMKETVIPIQEEGCAVIRSGGGSLVACGSACGMVALRDLRNPKKAEQTFRAHTACLSDLDMRGDLLISCGFTHSINGTALAESYVIVWDIRYLRGNAMENEGAWSIPTASPPLLLQFLPVFSGRAVALSGDGHVSLLYVNNIDEKQSVFQVETNNSTCSALDVSTTSQALVFGDHSGHLRMFSPHQNTDPVFNNHSRPTRFADTSLRLGVAPSCSVPPTATDRPSLNLDDKNINASRIPMPTLPPGEKWFNELPPEFYRKVFRRPKPIDPEVLRTMKMQGPIGYAPNPNPSCKRNQMPYIEDTLEDLISPKKDQNKTVIQPIPKHYQKIDIRYNKHSPNENEELEELNKSGLPGLEATLSNSYCNSMLQVLYYIPPVKATLLAHTCAKEFCLSCELGFLFRMLDTSEGAPCQATNFLRAFRTVPEAAALGLILPERGPDSRVDLVALIQSWNRFILQQIHSEILETRKKEKEIALLANSSPPKHRVIKNKMALPILNGQYPENFMFPGMEFLSPTEFNGANGMFQNSGNGILFPGESTFIPRESTLIPRESTLIPRESTLIPRESTLIPRESTLIHRESTLIPEGGNGDSTPNCENHDLKNNHSSEREESDISHLFAIGRNQLNRCMKCNKEEERESVVLACALQYSIPTREGEPRGFIELLRASLAARRSTPAWCDNCSRFTPTTQRGRIVRLPPILAVNCGGVTAHEKAYWAKGSPKDLPEMKRGSSNKPCRYGLHCARPGCRFKHPDRPSCSSNHSPNSPVQESLCVLPLHLVIRLQSDGDVIINDNKYQNHFSESPIAESQKNNKRIVATQTEQEYALCAAVMCVEDNPKNLVAYVQLAPKNATPQWYLFNDLCIVPVGPEEVVHFGAWWKTPCVLFYDSFNTQRVPNEVRS